MDTSTKPNVKSEWTSPVLLVILVVVVINNINPVLLLTLTVTL